MTESEPTSASDSSDPAWDPDEDWHQRCERAREAVEATGNPLYLWEFLHQWHTRAWLEGLDGSPEVPKDELHRRMYPFRRLPHWVESWIADFALRIHFLMRGLDERGKFAFADMPEGEVYAEVMRWSTEPSLTPPQCAALVPLALGMTREAGWNAFADYWAIQRAKRADEDVWMRSTHFPGATAPPMSTSEARKLVMQEYGYTDERAFRRLLAKGRKAGGHANYSATDKKGQTQEGG